MTIDEVIAKQNGKPRSRPRDEEHKLQCVCVNWFRYQHRELFLHLWAVPNGGARSKATAGKLKAEGVVAGVADLVLTVPNAKHHALFIEMKTRTGRQSEAQKKWQQAQEAKGYKYVVCRSVEDFIEAIEDYLNDGCDAIAPYGTIED